MSNLLGHNHKQYVQDQVKIRQKVLGQVSSSFENISWTNGKTSFVRLASSIDIEDWVEIITNETSNPGGVNNLGMRVITHLDGNRRVESLGLDDSYMGDTLANNLVLHGGTEYIELTTDKFDYLQKREGLASVTSSNAGDFVKSTKAYTDNSDFGFVAMPGIQSVDIKSKNMGSLREAQVSLRVNSPEQLELLETLYLRIGYSVFLDWGNSTYYTNSGRYRPHIWPDLIYYFLNPDSDLKECPTKFIQKIEDERDYSAGNYDALFGRVKNFSWEFNSEGYYDVSLTIVSWGDVIESLKVDSLYPGVDFDNFNETPDIASEYAVNKQDISYLNSFIYYATIFSGEQYIITTNINGISQTTSATVTGQPVRNTLIPNSRTTERYDFVTNGTTIIGTPVTTEITASEYSPELKYDRSQTTSAGKAISITSIFGDQPYCHVRLGDMLDFIKTKLLLYTEFCDAPIVDIDTNPSTNYCYNPGINVSADPSKVFISRRFPWGRPRVERMFLEVQPNVYYGGLNSTEYYTPRVATNVWPDQGPDDIDISTVIEPFDTKIDGVLAGNIMNIYLEKEFLYTTLEANRDEKTKKVSLLNFPRHYFK